MESGNQEFIYVIVSLWDHPANWAYASCAGQLLLSYMILIAEVLWEFVLMFLKRGVLCKVSEWILRTVFKSGTSQFLILFIDHLKFLLGCSHNDPVCHNLFMIMWVIFLFGTLTLWNICEDFLSSVAQTHVCCMWALFPVCYLHVAFWCSWSNIWYYSRSLRLGHPSVNA